MLYKIKDNEPLWTKYTSDTINVAGSYYNIDSTLTEDQIDEYILKRLSEEAKKTIYKGKKKLDRKK